MTRIICRHKQKGQFVPPKVLIVCHGRNTMCSRLWIDLLFSSSMESETTSCTCFYTMWWMSNVQLTIQSVFLFYNLLWVHTTLCSTQTSRCWKKVEEVGENVFIQAKSFSFSVDFLHDQSHSINGNMAYSDVRLLFHHRPQILFKTFVKNWFPLFIMNEVSICFKDYFILRLGLSCLI